MSNKDFPNSYSMFANVYSYMGLPLTRNIDSADVVVMGIPYDLGTTGRAGTRHGPQGVRLASGNLRWEEKRWPWQFSAMDRLQVIDYGDLEFKPSESCSMIETVIEHAGAVHAKGKKTLSFGGDHFVTLPLLRAVHEQHGPVALVHFDAHTDTYTPEYDEPESYDHGCMFYYAPKEGLVDSDHSIQVGIRTEYDNQSHLFEVIDAASANDLSSTDVVKAIRQRVGDMPVYLTFDIDCLDPAYAPGTGTPVVGGITTDRALKIIRGLQGLNIVGADVVEVAPSYDHAEITALAAATIGLEILYVMASEVG
ncbi:MAG: agmatinase [Porticoccaceae bacterium]|jgi:agmatinase|nr:agmatinase [Porticoccaceae bacterium]MBT7567154.1 agmatinase [Porticoccaceae bacterium]MBT7963464.1 agmatinase [Porticoccaceae bacterium]